jgi:3-oxoacyl-[acyl-carrier protein] reductase
VRLAGRTALVTGTSRGLGLEIARSFSAEGARVLCHARTREAAATAAETVAGEPVWGDLSAQEGVLETAAQAAAAAPELHVLVHNAGIGSPGAIDEHSWEQFDRVMAVNVKGLFLCVKAVYPAMKQQKKGKIINISSGTTQSGTPFFLHYVSSKAGVLGFTRALAREVGGDNICVNSIMPGLTISSPNQEGVTSPEQLADRRKRRAIQRDQYPADLVGTVIFLASDDSDFMTGQAIGVDGGMNMH